MTTIGSPSGPATFSSSATFSVASIHTALAYLVDALHRVGLGADVAADLVFAVHEEMQAAANRPGTYEVGVDVAVAVDVVTVTVRRPSAAASSSVVGRQRHLSHSTVFTRAVDTAVAALQRLDRDAVTAALSTASSAELATALVQTAAHSSVVLAVHADSPAAARQHVVTALAPFTVSGEVLADVELLASELVNSVMRHEDASEVEVDVAIDARHVVTVTVTGDVGTELFAQLMPPAGMPVPSNDDARGLQIVDALASAWGTRRQEGRTAVWFEVRPESANQSAVSVSADHGGPDAVDPGSPSGTEVASAAVVAAAVAKADAVAAVSEAEHVAAPDSVAAQAAVTADQAAQEAAEMTARAARSARAARAGAAVAAAEEVADAAARTVEAVQAQADSLAAAVAKGAAQRAVFVSKSAAPGDDAEAARREAVRMDESVVSAAVAKAEETARAAVLVARAVAAAAAAVAATTAAEAAAMEHEVLDAAVAVRAVTAATAHQLASDTVARAATLARATRTAAAASERLREANLQLQRAGRHDRAVALALQEAMLTQLPNSDYLELAARYLTAAEQDQVGGDWYDALVLPDSSTRLVIGDVVGHDIVAAGVMGQLRNILRALVWDRAESTAAVVTRLDRAMRDLHIETMATVILVAVDRPPADQPDYVGTLRWTNAGHPPPVLISADGAAVSLERATDVPLGVLPDSARMEHSHPIGAGCTLLLYTDGLIETRHENIEVGQRRLLEVLSSHHRLAPGAMLDAVLQDMVRNRPDDDVAVLAVRFFDRQTPVPHGQ